MYWFLPGSGVVFANYFFISYRSMHQMAYLKVNGHFHQRRRSTFNLTLTAVDGGHPSMSTSKTVTVIVNAINNHSPVFTADHYEAVINERAPAGSFVTGAVTATDADSHDDTAAAGAGDGDGGAGINGKILYSIVAGNERDRFTINQDTGLVTTGRRGLDREVEPVARLNISARDTAPSPRIAYTLLTVTIEDWNDNDPLFNDCPGTITLPQGAAAGTVVHNFVAIDGDAGDNGRVSYSLLGEFRIAEGFFFMEKIKTKGKKRRKKGRKKMKNFF